MMSIERGDILDGWSGRPQGGVAFSLVVATTPLFLPGIHKAAKNEEGYAASEKTLLPNKAFRKSLAPAL